MRRSVGWASLVAVGRRSEWPVVLVIVAMLATIAFAAAAAPRLLVEAENDSLELAIEQAPIPARQLTIRVISEFGPGVDDDPLEDQRTLLDEIAGDVDPDVLARYGPARFVADTSRFSVIGLDVQQSTGDAEPALPALPTFVTFRTHPEIDEHSTLIAGRTAARTDREIAGLPVIEFELSEESATELGWQLGDAVLLTSDASDLVTRQFNGGLPDHFVAELVGLRTLTPPDEPFWFGDARLHRPAIADTGTGANVFAFGMIVPDQLPVRPFMVGQRSPFLLEQRRDLPAGSITLDNADETLTGLTALEASFSRQPTLSRPGVAVGLAPVLRIEADQRSAAEATLVLATVGVFGVAFTTLIQLLLAIFARRRSSLTVARARGASRPQVVAASAAEVAAIAAAAIVVGAGSARSLIGGTPTSLELSLLVGLWLGSVAVATLLGVAEGMRPITVSARPNAHPGLGRWGRVAGIVLVVIAAAAVVTFRRRGLAIAAPGVDPLVVLLPVIVPLAIVHLTRWVLPVALRRVADRGLALGVGRLVGLRRVVAQPEATVGIVAVLVLSLTVGALGLGVDRALDQGAVDASWTEVGAPFRVETRDVATAERIGALPEAVVAASGGTRVNLERDDTTFSVQLISLDVPQLRQITAGTVADAAYPERLGRPDSEGRIPAIASTRMGGMRVRVGDELAGLGSRAGQVFVVIETRPEMFGRRTDWLIADRTAFAAVAGATPGFSSLAIDVPIGEAESLRRIADEAGIELDDRLAILDLQRDDPLSRAVRRGYLVAGLVAVSLALLALVAVAVVTARERRREVAVIGLLGAGRREIARAVASELIPAALTGVIVGTVVGWLIVRFYDDRYDLSAFAGGSAVSIRGDAFGLLALATTLLVSAIVVIGVLVRRIVRADSNEILRIDGAA